MTARFAARRTRAAGSGMLRELGVMVMCFGYLLINVCVISFLVKNAIFYFIVSQIKVIYDICIEMIFSTGYSLTCIIQNELLYEL